MWILISYQLHQKPGLKILNTNVNMTMTMEVKMFLLTHNYIAVI